ncbi:hypothetical protein A7X67_02030 [Clostridium sp. W14A]|nr:hypothetical protein A7X67_02030 [Clostridium sp. W14A]
MRLFVSEVGELELEDESVVTGVFDALDEADGLSEEETDSEDGFSEEPVSELTASPFAALQPHVKNKSADKQIENNLRDCI